MPRRVHSSANFYPRSPCGERRGRSRQRRDLLRFLSTLSLRRATSRGSVSMPKYRNFYPRSPCGERPVQLHAVGAVMPISIHALLAESDQLRLLRRAAQISFYPRSPCGERRRRKRQNQKDVSFLSTLSLRRATGGAREEFAEKMISIHALLAESDGGPASHAHRHQPFLSTLSLRRATLARGT